MNTGTVLEDAVDLARYPLRDLDGEHARAVIAAAARAVREDGVAILPGFVTAGAVARLVAEADALAPLAHHSEKSSTAYLAGPDPAYPLDHPRNHVIPSRLAALAYDQFPTDSILRALYEDDTVMEFIRRILGTDTLHRYGDPFGALNLAVMRDGDILGWHFDFTDFVVSLAIQSADAGGEFENAAGIRRRGPTPGEVAATDADVADVMHGRTPERVRIEPMVPGTLMVFNGRWSLHRVAEIHGPVPRYVGLLSYDTKPGTDSTDALKLQRYGRLPMPRQRPLVP